MKIYLNNWKLHLASTNAMQFDNETVKVNVQGDFPAEFDTWKLLLRYDDNMDVLLLSSEADSKSVTMTSGQLGFGGMYEFQIRAEKNDTETGTVSGLSYVVSKQFDSIASVTVDSVAVTAFTYSRGTRTLTFTTSQSGAISVAGITKVKHTEVMPVKIKRSINGDAQWPTLPSEFSQAEARINAATGHYPKIQNGTWWVWSVANGTWVDTTVSAKGDKGDTGATGNGIASTVLNADYTLTITFTDGTTYTTSSIRGAQGETGEAGEDGEDGADGVSPTLSSSKVGKTTTITYTDAQHPTPTTLATILDGADGQGSGDMTKATYDPAGGVRQVAFADEIPSSLSDLSDDSTHRLVTDTEKGTWNAKYTKPSSGIPDSDIASAAAWNAKATKPDLGTISISTTWTGSSSPYTQTVTVTGATVTATSKVDINPSATLIAQMVEDGCTALYIENNAGTLTLYAVGAGLTVAQSNVQVTVTEVT